MNRRHMPVFAALGVLACTPNVTSQDPFVGGTTPGSQGDPGSGDADDDGDEEGDGDGSTGADDSADEGPAPGGDGLPCDVLDVLAEDCWMCHSDPPKFGAPMSLTSHDDLLLPAVSDPARTVADLVAVRVNDPDGVMPPTGRLPEDRLSILTDWIAAGTPEYEGNDCEEPDVPDGGTGELPCEPSHTFTAHAPGGGGGFPVPVTDDVYVCFTWKSPFPAGAQITAYAPIVDDERVLHHWILYRTSEPQTEGGVGSCSQGLGNQFVAGWAPGGDIAVMPDDVGLETAGPDEWLILQMHYNNVAGYTDAVDASGIEMCTTNTPRPNLAGVLWLGSVLISIPPGAEDHPVTGTCDTSTWNEPFHVMSTSPHMHQLGRGFRTTINRAGGGSEILTDVPQFSFADQKDYPYEPYVTINPGDQLVSTCYFDNPGSSTVFFGEGTSDEMCFNFTTGYPIDRVPERMCGILF
jgi:hypothetical protein